jgi:ATP dependent DNA ligase domain
MAPTLVREPFHREGWVFEEKVDGWRMLAYKDGERVRLVSRNGRDHTRRFADIAAAIREALGSRAGARRRNRGLRPAASVAVRLAAWPAPPSSSRLRRSARRASVSRARCPTPLHGRLARRGCRRRRDGAIELRPPAHVVSRAGVAADVLHEGIEHSHTGATGTAWERLS